MRGKFTTFGTGMVSSNPGLLRRIGLTSKFAKGSLPDGGGAMLAKQGGLRMTALMVRCPSTGREVSTAIDTDGIDRLPKVGTKMRCPLCGDEHFWTSRDVWFAESARELHEPRS